MKIKTYFIGPNKSKPSFLVEVNPAKKLVTMYKPDSISAKQNFIERYTLGKMIFYKKYSTIKFETKPIPYKKRYLYAPSIQIK